MPVDSQLTRTFYKPKSHLPGKPALTNNDYPGFDTHSIFHDVFLDAGGNYLSAIGPPLVNLAKHLLPLKVFVQHNNQSIQLRHKQSNHDRVAFHRFQLPRALQNATEINTSWQFANEQRCDIIATRQQLSAVQLQFVTLQKNNPVQWIIDWLRYCQLIGVQRVLLYDNSSDNFGELDTALKTIAGLPDVVLIPWPFPYGPVKSFYNFFCQTSQNNHAYQCFGQSEWTGHFDVDEYLVVRSGRALRSMLDNAPRYWGLMRFDSFWVPDVENVLSSCREQRLPSARDFSYREKSSRNTAHKYIARNQHVKVAKTHNAIVNFGYKRKAVSVDDSAFLHYKSLTDDWRGYKKRVATETLDENKHVKDDVIQNCMKSIDLST